MLWLPLIACLIVALAQLVVRGAVIDEQAYRAFQAARDFQSLQDFGSLQFLYVALLAGANKLGLPIPATGLLLSAAGWLIAIAAVYVIGLRLNRPVMAVFAAGVLTLAPPSDVILWAGLALLAGSALDEFVKLVDRLPLISVDRRVLAGAITIIALLTVVWLGQPNLQRRDVAMQRLYQRASNLQHLALWQQAGQWLQKNTPPQSSVWSDASGANNVLAYFSERAITSTSPLSFTTQYATRNTQHAAHSTHFPPDYVVAVNSLTWAERISQPWFQEHYRRVMALANPYDGLAPLTIYRYWPGPFDIGPVINVGARFGPMELVSYRLDSPYLIPGEAQHLTLTWRTLEPLTRTFYVRVRICEPASGYVWAQVYNTTPANLKTRLWPVGRLLTDRYTLDSPADLPAGTFAVIVQVLYAEDEVVTGANLDHFLGDTVTLARLEAQPWISDTPLAAAVPFNATLGGAIALQGYSVQPAPVIEVAGSQVALVEHGISGALRLRLYWHALAAPEQTYHVFAHLLFPDGRLAAQHDGIPVNGAFPTDAWQAGQYILDEHIIPLGQSVPPGRYWLHVGMYAPDSGERLSVRDQAGQTAPDQSLPLIQVDVE